MEKVRSILEANGWAFSHTTPIRRHDGSVYNHHTFICPHDDQWRAGVDETPGTPTHVGRLGNGRMTTFFANALAKYLKRKNRELLRGCGNA